MNTFMLILGVIFGMIIIAYAGHRFFLCIVARSELNQDLKEVVLECKAVDARCENGYGVFYPQEDKRYLYEILVTRKIMVRNMMSGYGYSFLDCHKNLWDGMPPIISIPPEKYEDPKDVDVIAWDKEADGKYKPSLRVVGNTLVDAEGKVVKRITEKKGGVH